MAILIRLAGWLFRALPEKAALRLGRGLGAFWWSAVRYRRSLALANLEAAFGDEPPGKAESPPAARRREIARASFLHLGANLAEFLRLPALSDDEVLERMSFSGLERLAAARARGRGVIVVTAHVGHWEWLCVAQALCGLGITIVTRHAHDPAVDRLWQTIRRDRGVRFLDSADSMPAILRRLRQGEMVGLVIDQHEGGSSAVRVPFLGREAGTVRAPALLAARTGCPVLPAFSYRGPDGRHMADFGVEIPLVEGGDLEQTIALTTARYNEIVGDFVREHPEQWLWVHRRWKPA